MRMRFVHKNTKQLRASETPILPPSESSDEDNGSQSVYLKKRAAHRNGHNYGSGKKKVGASRAKAFTLPQKRAIHNWWMSWPRRIRVNWTPEEEDMLKKGVQKYSGTARKNIPWKKILKFGYGVFDVGRSPEDLKDKWRHMMVKEVRNRK